MRFDQGKKNETDGERSYKNFKFQEYGVKIKLGPMNHSLIDILERKKNTIIEVNLAVKPLLSPLDLGLNPAS